ncbi:binding-protein-dependent transport systems inner membrane component [Halovivax asiaticus JCM 14624]|uniref:Binding-protein-dependent transport systems inner membrane component n=1 Tax=Halovivax asiaticus JCM 14624 TaxID=1227490 RepID=M0BBL1_9EURY|nr:nickel transporter permease [Halovivax asiaticus]ELZ08210.1 binding-protein-dependent transport systems inner membrane component [Halovivax asiaticus JCM 14624]
MTDEPTVSDRLKSIGDRLRSVGVQARSKLGEARSRLVAAYHSRPVRQFRSNTLNVIGLVIVLTLILTAIFAPMLAPHDPEEQHLRDRLEGPSAEHPLGTDQLGQDVLSRLIFGARVSLKIGVAVVGISLAIGTAVGVTAGYAGGYVDEGLMRLVDVLLAFPGLLLALVIAGILGPSLTNIMIALAIVGWTSYARVVRGSVLSVKEEEYVKASQLMGTGRLRIVGRHVLPNVMGPVVVLATLDMATVILSTAGLSFLGLGAQPPTPEWGTMISEGRYYLRSAWWVVNFPGLAIMFAVLGFNLLGDGLRDVLDPREEESVQNKGL